MTPNVLLAAKLMAQGLLLAGLDGKLALAAPFRVAVGVVFLGAAALLFNRGPRAAAAVLGAAALGAAALGPGNSGLLFAGAFFVLVAVGGEGGAGRRLQRFTALAHLAAAIVLWSQPGAWPEWAPPLLAVTGAALLFGALRPAGVWSGVLVHVAALWVGAPDALWYVLPASYLVFAPWPEERMAVLYDGDCGFCETTRRWFERFDLDGVYRWQPFQSGAGERWGIPVGALERAAHVVADGRIHAGFRAFRAVTLFNPLTYFLLALLLALSGAFAPGARAWVATLAAALYFPLFRPVGEAVYQLIARNRHRLPGEKSCNVA